MLHQKSLTIPASTAATSPVSAELKLVAGMSTRREIEFPGGCVGLVGVRVFHGDWQIIPWSRDAWLQSDDNVVVDDSPYRIEPGLTIFTMYAYNTDTANDHTIQLRVQMHEAETEEFLHLEEFLDALRGV